MPFHIAPNGFVLTVSGMNADTIAAIASPPGRGAVALIRISGDHSLEIVRKIYRGCADLPPRSRFQHLGEIFDPQTGDVIDQVLMTHFPAPHSFTGEEVVEIGCHGGMLVTKAILDALYQSGAEPAQPGAFSQRAFLNGKIDLTQAEAIMDLISAKTELARRAANRQLRGGLGTEVESLRQNLIGLIAQVEAWIDFPEDDIDTDSQSALLARLDEILTRMDSLLATAEQGRFLREGVRTVIAGPPNAGKSSLLNLLLGFDRAIVNEAAGTTRDTIEEMINLNGFPIRLIDTAGIRDDGVSVEMEGILRSHNEIRQADLVLLVIDSSVSAEALQSIPIPQDNTRVMKILNKSDLPTHPDWKECHAESCTSISCLTGSGKDKVSAAIASLLSGETGAFATGDIVAINARHQHCLLTAESELAAARHKITGSESPEFIAVDLRSSLDAIGEIVGKTDIDEILSEIFSTFCIGK